MKLRLKSKMFGRLQKIWLQSRIDAYSRALHCIDCQRQNDLRAERMIHSEMARTLSRLRRYEKAALEFEH